MELELNNLLIALVLGVLGIAVSAVCYFKQRRSARLLNRIGSEVEDLTEKMAKIKEAFEHASGRLSDQSRHIAWLETRIRQPKLLDDEILQDETIHETPRATITERRHLVTALASRGQTSHQVAMALGMLQGEVELIMNLNQAAAR